ncbi:dUTPase-like [Phytophthora cactorum]|nr:dUTPase-like [Phytophthora cactorum]
MVLDNGEIVEGINIIEELHKVRDDSPEMHALYLQAVSRYQRTQLPTIGFRLEDEKAVIPTKRIIDVGYDLTVVAVFKQTTKLTTLFETFVSVEIPLGYYAEIVPRSSICKTGYILANNVGVIDPCYTGTLKVALIKVDPSMPDIELPAKIAQLIIKPYVVTEAYVKTTDHALTQRGSGGFGSTNLPM